MYRVADGDRAHASEALRRHYERGRLTVEELSERVELALLARTDTDLRAALDGLPNPWNPRELAPVARRVVSRAAWFIALVALWSFVTFVLLVAFVVVVATDAAAEAQLAVPLVWVALTWLVWRAWRRPARR